VTAQGSAYMRFRRALDRGNVTEALSAASELDFVGLVEARADPPPRCWRPREVQPGGAALARSLRGGDEEHRHPREPSGARAPRSTSRQPCCCRCARRAPQPPAVVQANRRGPCSLVAGRVMLALATRLGKALLAVPLLVLFTPLLLVGLRLRELLLRPRSCLRVFAHGMFSGDR